VPRRVEAAEVGLRCLSTANRVRRVVDERMVTAGLSLARAKVLQALARQGPSRQNELAATLDTAPRTVTQSLEALELDGLVERELDPADRRCKIATLTPAGSAALAAALRAGERELQRIFSAIGRQGLANLEDVLDAIDIEVSASAVERSS